MCTLSLYRVMQAKQKTNVVEQADVVFYLK